MLLLLDHWPFDRLRGAAAERVREKLPLFALAVAAGVIALAFCDSPFQAEIFRAGRTTASRRPRTA